MIHWLQILHGQHPCVEEDGICWWRDQRWQILTLKHDRHRLRQFI